VKFLCRGGVNVQADHIGDAIHAELAGDVGSMVFDGAGRDAQRGAHFLIGLAFHDELKEFTLTGRQAGELAAGGLHTLKDFLASGGGGEGAFHQGLQEGEADGLEADIYCAQAHGTQHVMHIRLVGDNDGRDAQAALLNLFQQMQAGGIVLVSAKDETARVRVRQILTELLRRRIGLHEAVRRGEALREVLTKLYILVHDVNGVWAHGCAFSLGHQTRNGFQHPVRIVVCGTAIGEM